MNRMYYTIYLAKDDSVVAHGTIKQLARELNRSENCVASLISKNSRGIHKKYIIVKELLEKE